MWCHAWLTASVYALLFVGWLACEEGTVNGRGRRIPGQADSYCNKRGYNTKLVRHETLSEFRIRTIYLTGMTVRMKALMVAFYGNS
jgi:hypothetical protein